MKGKKGLATTQALPAPFNAFPSCSPQGHFRTHCTPQGVVEQPLLFWMGLATTQAIACSA